MKYNICTLLFIFCSSAIFAQENFNFSKHSLDEIVNFESKFNSSLRDTVDFGIKNISNGSEESIPTTTYIFDRIEDKFNPRLHVWYHFDSTTNSLLGVRYSWGLYNPGFDANKNRALLEELTKEENGFQKKFKRICVDLRKEFGDETNNEIIVDKNHAYVQEITWDLDDKIIQASISFSRELQEFPGVGLAANFFHVEQYIRFK